MARTLEVPDHLMPSMMPWRSIARRAGGESGHGARYMDPQWARDLRSECSDQGIAFFMKRMTDKRPIPPELMLRQFPVAMLDRVAAA